MIRDKKTMNQINGLYPQYCFHFLHRLQTIKRTILTFLFCLPTSLYALLLVILLVYNGFTVFYVRLPFFPAKTTPVASSFQPEKFAGENTFHRHTSPASYVVREEKPPVILKTQLPSLQKRIVSLEPIKNSSVSRSKRARRRNATSKILRLGDKSRKFSVKIKVFLEKSSCKVKFFMTWISSVESFGQREFFTIESLFKSHPDACLVMVSNSLASKRGDLVFRPILEKGFQVISLKPDFDYIFKNTPAEIWFSRLKKGNVDPGFIPLGQNLSNLLRLSLLYKFGGIYLDTDVIVLKNLSGLRNTIGAQAMDSETKNWTRLNNAILIFDKNHPLVWKFIQEFALTFNGNKWGHNGPYLVSRVAARVNGRPGFNFTVLPPSAFYPVNWSRIRSLFRRPTTGVHSRWVSKKLEFIRRESFALHLWNRQSKLLRIEERSIIDHIMVDCCIFCNSSRSSRS